MATVLQPPIHSAPAPTDINDWSNTAMNVIASALGMVPEVGSLLSGLVYILWPSDQNDVWDDIKGQVQQLIDQNLTQLVQNLETQTLQGLKSSIQDYQDALTTNDPSNISQNWTSAKLNFVQQLPQFQVQGYQVALLPYYAQAVNLYLALLRDGVLHGKDWGWKDADVAVATKEMNQVIQDACQWVDTTFGTENETRLVAFGQAQTDYLKFTGQNNPPVDYPLGPHYNVNVWNLYNNFLFWMTLRVLDFRNVWPYFTGGPVEVVLTREIYGTACGTSDYELIPDTPWETIPTQPVNRIEVFAGDRIDGVRLTYPPGGGPNGQTQIVCGDPFHSTGVTLFADQDPLVEVTVYAGDIVSALSFEAKNGDQSGQIANNKPPGSEVTVLWAPPGEIISSVYINGTDQFYQSANLIIFGFQYQRKTTADLTALRHLYVCSPSQIDLTELAARCVTKPVSIDALKAAAETEGWDAQRRQYRNSLTRRSTAAKRPRRAS